MRRSKVRMEAGTVRVRKATPKDVRTVAQLIRGLARYEKLDKLCRTSARRLRSDGFGRAAERCFEAMLAERDGNAVGFALYVFMYSTFRCRPTLYVEDLFVVPEARREGVGKALLRELARVAVSRGCGQMKWMVLDWNEPAFQFYRKFGAGIVKEWTLMQLDEQDMRRLARNA